MHSNQLPWIAPHWNNLQSQVAADRLPHAMLWISPDGLGAKEFALFYLQWLMCSEPGSEGACGHCNHCNLFMAGTHPDFHHLTLLDKSKDIKIEQIRDLISKLVERPYQGGKRLVLVEPADRLNRSAANAFLKTLEEPGDDTFILLLTSRPEALGATIRSRCQAIHIQAPDEQQAFDYVQDKLPDDPAIARQAIKYAQNQPLTAVEMIESGSLQQRSDFISYLAASASGHLDPVALAGQYKQPAQVAEICDWLFSMMSDAERHASGLVDDHPEAPDYVSLVDTVAAKSPERRKIWLDKLTECKRTMIKGTNVNPTLTMESLMTGWIAFLAD